MSLPEIKKKVFEILETQSNNKVRKYARDNNLDDDLRKGDTWEAILEDLEQGGESSDGTEKYTPIDSLIMAHEEDRDEEEEEKTSVAFNLEEYEDEEGRSEDFNIEGDEVEQSTEDDTDDSSEDPKDGDVLEEDQQGVLGKDNPGVEDAENIHTESEEAPDDGESREDRPDDYDEMDLDEAHLTDLEEVPPEDVPDGFDKDLGDPIELDRAHIEDPTEKEEAPAEAALEQTDKKIEIDEAHIQDTQEKTLEYAPTKEIEEGNVGEMPEDPSSTQGDRSEGEGEESEEASQETSLEFSDIPFSDRPEEFDTEKELLLWLTEDNAGKRFIKHLLNQDGDRSSYISRLKRFVTKKTDFSLNNIDFDNLLESLA